MVVVKFISRIILLLNLVIEVGGYYDKELLY